MYTVQRYYTFCSHTTVTDNLQLPATFPPPLWLEMQVEGSLCLPPPPLLLEMRPEGPSLPTTPSIAQNAAATTPSITQNANGGLSLPATPSIAQNASKGVPSASHHHLQYFSVPHVFRSEPIGATQYHSDSERTPNFRLESARNLIRSERFQSDSERILSGII